MNYIFETKRLLFRRFTIKDTGRLAYLFNDEEISKYLSSFPYPYTEVQAKEWIRLHNENFIQNKMYDFAIIDKYDEKIIGTIGLSHNIKHKNGSVSYVIGKEYWNQGYATEALKGIIEYAFSMKAYHKVYAEHFEDNKASGRVMQRAGMIYEGEKIDHIYKDEKYITLKTYYILNDN